MSAAGGGMTTCKTLVWPDPDGFLLMHEDGQLDKQRSAAAVIEAIKQRDAIAAKAGRSTIRIVEWRDMPEGFVAPELNA